MSEEKHHRGLFHHHKDEDKPSDYPQSGYSDEGRPGGLGGGYGDTNDYSGEGRTGGLGGGYGDTNAYSAAGAFALHEKHNEKKDPEHAHRHKIEEEIAAAAAVGSGGFAFHEHHEKKETKEEEEEAYGKKKHHHF
ncbi:hypothetical protein C1H46_018204 [Malus baccata]|uniref:Uncharacterized protein n=1 Tax=Malus baccata TaxID=106549 RepID=A0A540MBR1_MALBA|nr:hypothetical protein C1H46_018204 [Malus baccata]